MTRQPLGDRAALLDLRELARSCAEGAATFASGSDVQTVVVALGSQRVAVLQYVTTTATMVNDPDANAEGNSSFGVRLGVFKNADGAGSTAAATAQWTSLWTEEETEAARKRIEEATQGGERDDEDELMWSLAWSPDGKYLVVSGIVINAQTKKPEASVWIVSSREWMAIEDAAAMSSSSPFLTLRVDPAKHLGAKEFAKSSQLVSLFFLKSKSNRLFFVTSDGVLVKMDVQVPKLALLTLNNTGEATLSATDKKSLFQLKVVKRMSEWHAGVSAATFEVNSGTLVVAGGLKNPSEELVQGRASSLSVWKMLDSEPFCELLDYTMVLSEEQRAGDDDDADSTAGVAGEQSSHGELTQSAQNSSSSSLLQSVKGSLFSPLKFMIGEDATSSSSTILRGSIRQLALSPGGVYVTMLDVQGRFSVRQIDTCSDVVGWQLVDSLSSSSRCVTVAELLEHVGSLASVKSLTWVSPNLLAFVLTNGWVVYGELVRQLGLEGMVSNEVQDPAQAPSSASATAALGGIEIISVHSHHRSFPGLFEKAVHVDAVAPILHAEDESGGATMRGYQLLTVNGVTTIAAFETVDLEAFVELLMKSHQFDRALDVVEAHGMTGVINLDAIHRQIWSQFRALATVETMENGCSVLATERAYPGNGFNKALHHLSLIQDKKWVVDQCLHVVTWSSFAHMKEILGAGLRAVMGISEDNAVADATQDETVVASQEKLLRFIYRLDTLKLLLAEDLVETDELLATNDDADPSRLAEEKYYDGAAFAQFRSVLIVEIAKQLACEGRVGSLGVLFQRNAWTLIPRRLEVLSLLPASASPVAYAHLLPAVGPDSRNEWQFYTLQPQASAEEEAGSGDILDGSSHRVVEVELNPENRSHDLEAEELALFELKARQSGQERREEYANWFQTRILEMDSLFGQLANAFHLSSLAKECVHGWQDDEDPRKSEFEMFQRDIERLYSCIYPLQLSSCCLLSLQEWSALPLHDQILCAIGSDWDSVTDVIDRIHAVFVAQRGGDTLCTLDDAFSTLCHTLSRKSSLPVLELCAQLIHHSNPSMPVVERWIQNDARLLRTSIDVVYSATTSGYFRSVEELNAQHGTFVEQLWTIFQSLPIRKEDDPPEIEQLQVEVDEMEDLMVTMDVLNKYGVHTSPTELKMQIGEASITAADDLLQRMCRFSLPGTTTTETNADGVSASDDEAQQWMEVWRDATKLKTHVFGERISQEAILDVILRHLLSHDVYLDAAEHLMTNWTGSNFEVIHHVIVVLIRAIQAKVDTLKGNFVSESDLQAHFAALKCIDITKRVLLSSPALEQEPDRKKHYERQLRHETELVHACQLLDLLTYGAVKLTPAAIRPLKDAKDRLEVVLKVFTSNPSHYQPSNRAREWLKHHNLESVVSSDGTKPLEAVLYLAKLLRVDDHKHQIVMKGAYAALYCADYDVTYGLTNEVIESIRVTVEPQHPHYQDGEKSHRSRSDDVELQHLMSLVLDLISASSFRSWSKKLKLCRLVFSAQNVSSTSLFSHQITNLIMAAMQRLEAVEALASELGLSEADVEERRHQDTSKRSSVEELLLKELEIVVGLLQEEKNDRGFLLRLLQKGFQLVTIVLTGAITQQSDDDDQPVQSTADEAVVLQETQRSARMAQQMALICVEEAIASTNTSDSRVFLEMGLSYFLLWSDFSTDNRCDLEGFWEQEILPLLTSAAESSTTSGQGSDELVRQCHHFFMLQVASALQGDDDDMSSVAQGLQERRKCLNTFVASYEETKRFVLSKNFEPEAEGDDELADADEHHTNSSRKLVFSTSKRDVFARLAKRCQDMMVSQKKTQELEEMNSFFNENLDLERFSRDSEYRVSKILMLATTKEHYQVAKQFATKYGVDEYQCLLAYIKSVFLPAASSSSLNRHEQLEIAFRSENEDFLEQALEKPFVFGNFLLNNNGDSVYELLDGTDHVGILLLLRMVLECSKRITQLSKDGIGQTEVDAGSLFPLSKESSDRITLLFMCLKRLKELERVKRRSRIEVVDFKLVCAAETCSELLHAPSPNSSNASESRQVAIEALLPFLNGKTIKMLTKILQKLHHVTTSAVVMVYLSDMLHHIWLEQRGHQNGEHGTLSGDLAAYAYEACTPFLSVLTNEHVMLFHCLFLNRDLESNRSYTDSEEFYGQSMDGVTHFGAFLTPQKRLELISDTLTLFQTRFDAWKVANSEQQVDGEAPAAKESELQFLESELVEATFWFIAHEVKTNGILFPAVVQVDWEHWEALMKAWFSFDTEQKVQKKAELRGFLVLLCQLVSSVEIASLMTELVLLASKSEESDAAILGDIYRRVFASGVDRTLSSDRAEDLQQAIVRQWVTSFPDAHIKISEQLEGAAGFISTLCSRSTTGKPANNSTSERTYQRVLSQLDQLPSLALKHIVESRKQSLQTAESGSDPQKNTANAAVTAEWRHLVQRWEEEKKWTLSAVLTRLVLDGGVAANATAEELLMYERECFGLQTKAVFSLLQRQHRETQDFAFVFSIPTDQVYEQFDAVFAQALAVLSSSAVTAGSRDQGRQTALTTALANLLFFHDDISQKQHQKRSSSFHTWEREQRHALTKRIQDQFSIGSNLGEDTVTTFAESDETNWWSQLLLHSHWDNDDKLTTWYLELGYAKITSPRVLEAFAMAHWETKKLLCVELILLSPFSKLHTHHRDRLLQSARGSGSKQRILELLLLRFGVQTLLHAGLYHDLLSLHLNDELQTKKLLWWTSSGEYLVCALVMLKEFATAARLTCALWHVHPLLWDYENARLTLANYLKRLATAQPPATAGDGDDEAILRHEVYGRAFNFFQRSMTM
ncbi:hypothetical protein Gpo141_00011138 [Globisporangium polare]